MPCVDDGGVPCPTAELQTDAITNEKTTNRIRAPTNMNCSLEPVWQLGLEFRYGEENLTLFSSE